VGPMTQQNFELLSTKSRDGTHNIEYDGPVMGLSKNVSHYKSEGNVKVEQKGPKHVEKVYSRSSGCRKQMEHGFNDGLLKKTNIQALNEISNAFDRLVEHSQEMKGSGLEKLVERTEMNTVEIHHRTQFKLIVWKCVTK